MTRTFGIYSFLLFCSYEIDSLEYLYIGMHQNQYWSWSFGFEVLVLVWFWYWGIGFDMVLVILALVLIWYWLYWFWFWYDIGGIGFRSDMVLAVLVLVLIWYWWYWFWFWSWGLDENIDFERVYLECFPVYCLIFILLRWTSNIMLYIDKNEIFPRNYKLRIVKTFFGYFLQFNSAIRVEK